MSRNHNSNPTVGPVILILVLAAIILFGLGATAGILGWIIINSLIGLVLLMLVNFFPFIDININIWTVLVVAIGGIPGLVLLILLDLAGFPV